MTEVISVLNFKGGTGKTTTVMNLAAGLALRGEKVLCIDLDAQGSLSTSFGVDHPYSLTHLLLGETGLDQCIVGARSNLDLIVGDSSLLRAEGALWRSSENGSTRRVLSDRLSSISGYDYIFLDHSPSVSLLSENGLSFARHLIVPISMSYLALIGTRQVLEKLEDLNRTCELFLVVPTFFDSRLRKDNSVMQVLQKHFRPILADPIRVNVSLAEAMGQQKSIYEYSPRSTGAMDYASLVERVAANGRE